MSAQLVTKVTKMKNNDSIALVSILGVYELLKLRYKTEQLTIYIIKKQHSVL